MQIEEAKKYIFKKLYFADTDKVKPTTLYIGGVNLFYNNVDYDVTGFAVYEDKECENYYGDVKIENIENKFKKEGWLVYSFSYNVAIEYLVYQKRTEREKERDNDIETAKELLEKHKINFEIFD